MSDRKSIDSPSGDSPHADHVVDALLTQMAACDNGDDEAFLARVETAIDRDAEDGAILRPSFRSLLRWATGAAAVVTLGLSAWYFGSLSTEENAGPLIIGRSDDPAPDVHVDPVAKPAPQPKLPTDYVLRMQENVKRADEAALRGANLMAGGDYQGAIDQYRAALDLLPDAPMTEPRRRAYVSQFSRASVLLATQRAEEGRYLESIALVEDVLQPRIDPDNIDAKRLLERLDDPDYFSPALNPSHLERRRRVPLPE